REYIDTLAYCEALVRCSDKAHVGDLLKWLDNRHGELVRARRLGLASQEYILPLTAFVGGVLPGFDKDSAADKLRQLLSLPETERSERWTKQLQPEAEQKDPRGDRLLLAQLLNRLLDRLANKPLDVKELNDACQLVQILTGQVRSAEANFLFMLRDGLAYM